MAKIIFIPEWLRELCEESGKPMLKSLSDKNINSSILSKHDVINYNKVQIEFFKFIICEKFNSIEEFKYYFSQIMWSELSTLPEVSIYMNENYDKPVDDSLLICNEHDISKTEYQVKLSSDNKISYIIGGSVEYNPLNALPVTTVRADRQEVIRAVLGKSYSGFRIINETTDRSSVFRENNYLTQLYVKNLCNI